MVCSVTVLLLLLEIQIVKGGINKKRYHKGFGETLSCMNRMMGAMVGLSQRKHKFTTKVFYLLVFGLP